MRATGQATEQALRVLAKASAIAQAADDATVAIDALESSDTLGDASRWLPSLRDSLQRIRLECTEIRFAAHQVYTGLPSPETLQPRLF